MPHRRAVAIAVHCLVLAATVAPASAGPEIDWATSLGPALKQAASSGKPALVDVWAIWCVPCKEMDETTYRDDRVVSSAEEFVPVKIDHDLQELFVERYDVEALPLVLFLDAEGREISRMFGLIEAPRLLELMKVVREGYAGYLEAMARPKDPAAAESVGAYLLAAGNAEGAADTLRKALKRLKDEPASTREPLELLQAEAWLAAGQLKPATAAFERVTAESADRETLGRALQGLARAQMEKGGVAAASATLERLRAEYPERAEQLAALAVAP